MTYPTAPLTAQRLAWNWYFGTNAGVTFKNGIPEPLTDGRIDTDEGCAVMSNPATGALMFYTDGSEVRNSFHQVMPNGTGLQGERSTSQSAMIIPWPGSSDLYAIFNPAPITAIDPGGRCMCLKYSVVDMRRDGGFGDVIVKNALVTDGITEHVTATQDCDGTGWWIIVRVRESSAFRAYHFTADGVSAVPVVSPSISGAEIRDAGQMHVSPNGKMVVITSPSGSTQIYRFMRSTGTMFNGIDLFGADRSGIHYGAAFTADSRYLYVASTVLTPIEGAFITRFDLSTDNNDSIIASKQVIGFIKGTTAFTPLQLAPDKNIYIGRPNEQHLASIPNPSSPSPVILDTAVVLTGTCRSGLPYFLHWYYAPHIIGDPACMMPVAYAENVSVCVNECVQLVDESQGSISSWSWNIPGGIPTSPRIPSPVVCFSKPGLHKATLTVSNIYGDDTVDVFINVFAGPDLQVPSVINTCSGRPVTIPTSGAATYRWSPTNGLNDPTDSQPIARVSNTMTYSVIGTSVDGCKDTSYITIVVDTLTAGADMTICPGGEATLHASGAETYEWQPQQLVDDPTSPSPVATPDTTTWFTVTMKKGDCIVVDTVVVNVEPSFSVKIEGPTTACIGEVIAVKAVGGGSLFSWRGSGVKPSITNETEILISEPTVIYVVAQSGNCVGSDSLVIAITSGPVVNVSSDTAICKGSSAVLTASGNASRYEWRDAQGTVLSTENNLEVTPNHNTTYHLLGFGTGTCSTQDSITVTILDAPTIHAGGTKRICLGSAVRLGATGVADTYLWTPSSGLDNPATLAPIASPEVTTTYTLTAVRNGCVTVDSTTVYVSTLKITPPENVQVCAGSAIELNLSGATSYRWDPPDGLSDPTIPNPIASPKVSTTYRIVATDPIGCEDELTLRVTVIDTTRLTIRATTITAMAGTQNVEIPILVDADPSALPMFADSLRADIIVPSDVLLPTGFDRGRLSISTRGKNRVIRMVQPNVQIVNSTQRVNSLYGTVLAGSLLDAPIFFEKVEWVGITCPTSGSVPGRLLITGCYLQGRTLRFFDDLQVNTTARPGDDVVDVEINGSIPGAITIQLFSANGGLLAQENTSRTGDSQAPLRCSFNMQAFAGGMYFVVTTTPTGSRVDQVLWLP